MTHPRWTWGVGDHDVLDSEVHGAYMGTTWSRQYSGCPHVGPMILAIRGCTSAGQHDWIMFNWEWIDSVVAKLWHLHYARRPPRCLGIIPKSLCCIWNAGQQYNNNGDMSGFRMATHLWGKAATTTSDWNQLATDVNIKLLWLVSSVKARYPEARNNGIVIF